MQTRHPHSGPARRTLLGTTFLLLLPALLAAAPMGTYLPEPMEVTDEQNLTFNRIGGVNLDVNSDGQPDVNLAWLGISINSIFAYDGIASGPRDLGNGSILPGSLGVVTSGLDTNNRVRLRRFAEGETILPEPGQLSGAGQFAEAIYESFFDGLQGGEFFAPENQEGYLGFAFVIGTATHHGWVRIRADNSEDTTRGSVFILGYGYETTAATGLAAGAGAELPLQITSVAVSGADLALTWNSKTGVVYRVESRTNLESAPWIELSSDVPSAGSTTSFAHTNGATGLRGFYRVHQLP